MINDISMTFDVTERGLSLPALDVRYQCADIYRKHSFCYTDNGSFLLFIGICYNQADLMFCSGEEWPQLLYRRFRENNVALLEELDGCFSGLYFDAASGEAQLFSDHLATLPLYYCRMDKFLIVDTDLFRLAGEYRRRGKVLRLSERGAHAMLAYSFMLGCDTLLEGVYKVQPAGIYSWRTDRTTTYFHYYSTDKDYTQTPELAAETIDRLFSAAIDDAFSADGIAEHLLMLSGGLDSRMCLLYALRNGYDHITTINYSQTFYREELIAKALAADHGCEHIFFSLDHGRYLSHIDEGIRATQGMTTYRPILQARMVWNRMQMNRYGHVHSGLLGDTVIGGYCIEKCHPDDRFHSPEDLAIQLNAKNKSIISAPYCIEFRSLFNRILDWIPMDELTKLPSEQFVLDNRYINGLMQSSLGTRGLAVHSSAFTSKALMSYIYSLPSHWRMNHKLYFTWIKRYMPEATRYQWENTGLKPMYGLFAVHPHDKVAALTRRLDSMIHPKRPERSRNPYSYWMKQNQQIEQELYDYCLIRLCVLEGHSELMDYAQRILKHHNIYLMIRLATLVGFLWMCCQPIDEQEER